MAIRKHGSADDQVVEAEPAERLEATASPAGWDMYQEAALAEENDGADS